MVNYVSVMNYTFQFEAIVNTGKAAAAPTRWRLDYSRQKLPLNLTEGSLNEGEGVGAFAEPGELLGASNNFVVFGPANVVTKPTAVAVNPAGGSVNWNKTGAVNQAGVPVDLNNLGVSGCGPATGTFPLNAQTHVGFDDWANLQLNFRASSDFADGAHSTIDESKEGGSLDLAFEDVAQLSPNVIDIVPGDSQNRLLRGFPLLPVAFLGSELLDARDVDPSSATLTEAGASWIARVERILGKPACLLLDINRDGRRDLVCKFDVSRAKLAVGVHEIQLDATTFDGRVVRNGDLLRVIQLFGH
jgi:hypothetical protein